MFVCGKNGCRLNAQNLYTNLTTTAMAMDCFRNVYNLYDFSGFNNMLNLFAVHTQSR